MSARKDNDHMAIPCPVPLARLLVLVLSLALNTQQAAHPRPQPLRYKSRPGRWCVPRDAYNLGSANANNYF